MAAGGDGERQAMSGGNGNLPPPADDACADCALAQHHASVVVAGGGGDGRGWRRRCSRVTAARRSGTACMLVRGACTACRKPAALMRAWPTPLCSLVSPHPVLTPDCPMLQG